MAHTTTLNIKGMTCDHCKRAVEGALRGLYGVSQAVVDLKNNKASVTFDEDQVSMEKLKQAVEEEGYEVV